MFKLIRAGLAFVLAGGSAYAGSYAFIEPQAAGIEEAGGMMGGSGAWLIPLVIVGVLALAMSESKGS